MPLYGAIEAGGTKFVCATGTSPDDLRAETRLPTTTPEETLGQTLDFFREQHARQPLAAIGVGSFGPVDPDPGSPTFGRITTTPKPGWADTDFVGQVRQALDLPVGFDTDVNAAALGEHRWGAAQGLSTFIYLTVGTGIGGGGLYEGRLLHGLMHPEMGHVPVQRDPVRDPFEGSCPFHGDCLEGLAAGPAIEARWGRPAGDLEPEHPAWKLEAEYLAQGLASFVYVLSPQRLILGGGVMQQRHLFPLVRQALLERLNGYVKVPALVDDIDTFVVPPGLGNRAGIAGALALAERAAS